MTRDNATSRTREIAGCLVAVSTSTETAAPGGGMLAAGRAGNPAAAWSLAAALLGFFVVTLDAVIVNVALPAIRRELAGGMSGLQWVVDGYTLMFAALLLSAGSLSDRVGARTLIAGGLLSMTTGLVVVGPLPATAPVALLSALMILVGLAGPLVVPPVMALLLQAVPARRAGVASGVFNTSRQVGGALAIAVFGTLVASRATFLPGLRVSLLIAAGVVLAAAAVSVRIRPSRPLPT